MEIGFGGGAKLCWLAALLLLRTGACRGGEELDLPGSVEFVYAVRECCPPEELECRADGGATALPFGFDDVDPAVGGKPRSLFEEADELAAAAAAISRFRLEERI